MIWTRCCGCVPPSIRWGIMNPGKIIPVFCAVVAKGAPSQHLKQWDSEKVDYSPGPQVFRPARASRSLDEFSGGRKLTTSLRYLNLQQPDSL